MGIGKNTSRRAHWAEIQLRFSYGETLTALAKEYEIPLQTVRSRAAREKWVHNKDIIQNQLQQKRTEHIQDNLIKKQNDVLEKQFATATAVYLQYSQLLAEAGEQNNAKLIVACQKTLAWAVTSLRQCTGLPDRVIETHQINDTDSVRIEKTIATLRERFSAPEPPQIVEAVVVEEPEADE